MTLFYLLMAVLAVVTLTLIVAAVLQWLWNMTMPDVFGSKTVRFWQAFRLMLIAGILFGPGMALDFAA